MDMRLDVTALKQQYSLVALVEADTGEQVRRGKNVHCPFHQDSDPSFSVNAEKGVFHCFGCGASGDVMDYMGYKHIAGYDHRQRGVYFVRVIEIMMTSTPPAPVARKTNQPTSLPKPLIVHADLWSHQLWDDPEQTRLREWLADRGITEDIGRHFQLGFIGRDPGLSVYWHNRLAILWKQQGKVVAVKTRIWGEGGLNKKRYQYLTGSQRDHIFFNHDALDVYSDLVLQESELDSMAWLGVSGKDNGIGLEAATFKQAHALALRGKRLTMLLDGDEGGINACLTVRHYYPRLSVRFFPKGVKDLGEAFSKGIYPEWLYREMQ